MLRFAFEVQIGKRAKNVGQKKRLQFHWGLTIGKATLKLQPPP